MEIKKQLRKVANHLVHTVSYKKTILFESAPDCSDNTKAVFDEMVRKGLHKKYTLTWMLHSQTLPQHTVPGVRYLPAKGQGFVYRWRYFNAYARAKCMLSCNGFLLPVLPEQKAFFLCHGTPVKSHRHYYTVPTQIQYCLVASESAAKVVSYEANYPEEQIYALGFPRNDVFSAAPKDIKSALKTSCKKVVAWYPTFRQHKNGEKTAAMNTLPIIHNANKARALNEVAREADVLIVLKPHFAQDLTYIKELNLSNIRLINDDFFAKNGISSYEFLAASDAMVTDYSSVYYDYTLADKPIAVVWEDFDAYKENPGFALDMKQCMSGAEKIFTVEDYEGFIRNVASDQDVLRDERRKIRDWANYSADGKNSQRVVDFIIDKAKL